MNGCVEEKFRGKRKMDEWRLNDSKWNKAKVCGTIE